MKFTERDGLNLFGVNEEVLKEWDKNDLFHRSIDEREGCPSFVFFEGPPSANGHPGIHHVMARTIKDVFCRYKTMQGFQVKRKAGWDTHGLPVELGVEKELGITKEDIGKTISIEEYNAQCRRNVMKFTQEWTDLSHLMGYWVDMEHPYITYDNAYIESLWWLLSQLYQKGLLYKGYTIQPYSPAAGTGLSSHELNQPGCYRDVNNTRTIFCGYVIAQNHAETKFFEFHKLVMAHFKHGIGISLSIFLDKIRCRVCQLFCRFHPRHQLRITHALKFMPLMAANDAIRNHLVAGLVVFQRKFCAFNLEVGRQAVGREHNSDRLCRIWIVSTNRYVFK